MRTVHVIKFRLEFKPKLDFFFVIFSVLKVVFLQLKPHLLFVCPFSLDFLGISGQSIVVVSQDFLVVSLLQKLGLVFLLKLIKFSFMFFRNFTDQHSVVSTTTILKQNSKNFPHVGYKSVFLFSVLEALLYEFVESNRINKERAVHTVNKFVRNSRVRKRHSIDAVTADWIFMFRL